MTPRHSRSPSFRLLCVLVLSGLGASLAGRAEEPVDLRPVHAWLDRQAGLKSLEGAFVQERQLKTLRRPLRKEGKFWYVAPDRMRWEVGADPADLIAVRNPGGVLLLRPRDQELERIAAADVEEDERLRGLGFLRAGFPRGPEGFLKEFTVQSVTLEGEYQVVEAILNDTQARLAVRKMLFYVHDATHRLGGFRLFFRDGSVIYTRFTELRADVPVDPALFEPALEGYRESGSPS